MSSPDSSRSWPSFSWRWHSALRWVTSRGAVDIAFCPHGLRIGSVVAIAIYALIDAIVLDRAGLIDVLPDPVSVVGAWVVFGYLVFANGLNAISRSKLERYTMLPVTIVLAVCGLIVASG